MTQARITWLGVLVACGLMVATRINISHPFEWFPIALTPLCLLMALYRLAGEKSRAARIASPVLFGLGIIWAWEMLVVGLHVPFILLPPPSAIAVAFYNNLGLLGLTPLANMFSAMPIVGIAPIAIEWFGFDWPSKAAVVTLMTVFPMLVNTQAGLRESGAMERDLMRSYGASYWHTLIKLRLPAAMPMIFNALKLNSTLALIGAVVAEFFGTPTRGMGFRISTESARMNLDIVWATITVAALAGGISFALIAWGERAVTFWHPSFHKRQTN
jgi:NitT/TauT family transport system permease protein